MEMETKETNCDEYDLNDIGLKGVMGDKFRDMTQSVKTPGTVEQKPVKAASKPAKAQEDKPADASWEPAKPELDWMDKLKACAKWVILFGGLNMLLFYWQHAGLMAESIAVPSMCICAALAGWGVGRNVAR